MSKYLGDVSAYAYAVSKGYTGTEEEFAELMASYAEVAEEARGYADDAQASAEDAERFANNASASASTATTKAGEASQSATNAQQSATNASQSATQASGSVTTAQGAAQTATAKADEASASAASALQQAQNAMTHASNAQTFANNAQTSATQAAASANTANDSANLAVEAAEEATTTVANKADKDGSYPDLSVGNVFSDDSYTEDKTPYLYRVSGGGIEVGKVEADQIVGGTIAWNQLMPIPSGSTTQTLNNVTITDNRDGTYSVSTTPEGASALTSVSLLDITSIARGHKMFMGGGPSNSSATTAFLLDRWAGRRYIKDTIREVTASGVTVGIEVASGAIITTPMVFKPQVFDLTQMFGSTIADYIYSLEQATAGAGVAFFRKMFPNAYYPYNAGELKSVEGLQSHDMVGFNQFDEDSAKWIADYYITANGGQDSSSSYRNTSTYIRVRPNTTYAYRVYKTSTATTSLSVAFYDADKNFISRSTPSTETTQIGVNTAVFTTPVNACYARLNAPTNSKDICINISSDRNGEYEPYEKHSYPLDSTLTLMGIPKVADGKMYYDGDVYSADGTVTRKYGVITYDGSTDEAWRINTVGSPIFYIENSYLKKVADYRGEIICDKLETTQSHGYMTDDYIITGYNDVNNQYLNQNWIYVRVNSSITDISSLKTWLQSNPITLVYELATPTEETAEPYTEYQKVSNGGTEEYVSTGIVPVGHNTKYPTDIVSKVDGLPSDFSTLIAPTEKGFTASKAYSVNQFMIIDNQLYKATANIASGATITVGTNVTATTIADILTSLLNA